MSVVDSARRRRSEKSRHSILSAALALAGEVAYSKISIEGIAARAGVGKQTIYRWWPSKAAVLLDAILALSENAAGETTLPDTGDIEADLKTVLRATVRELTDPRYDLPMRSLTMALLEDPDLAAEYRERVDRPLTEAKKARLRSAQVSGQIAADADLDVAVELIFAPLMARWLTRDGPLTEAYADALADAALSGLRPRG